MIRILTPLLALAGMVGCSVAPLNDLDRRSLTNYTVCLKIHQFRGDRSKRTAEYRSSVLDERDARKIDCDVYESQIQAAEAEAAARNAASSAALMSIGAGLLQSSQPQPNYAPPQPTYPTHCRIVRNPFGDRMVCN